MSLVTTLKSLAASAFNGAAGRLSSRYMPPAEELFDTPLSAAADEFLTACNIDFNNKQQRLTEQWLSDCERYDVDFERGVLSIARKDGPAVIFDVALVGSHNRTEGVWEWAWNNPNVEASLAVPKSALAPIGREFQLKYLLSGFVPVPMEDFPWYLCGIALKVTGALGTYLATHGDVEYYLLLDNPSEDVR